MKHSSKDYFEDDFEDVGIRMGEDKENPYAIYDKLGIPYPLPLIKSDKPEDVKHRPIYSYPNPLPSIDHIRWNPASPIMTYDKNRCEALKEFSISMIGHSCGDIQYYPIYTFPYYKTRVFDSIIPVCEEDSAGFNLSIHFSSEFESGNLYKAFQVKGRNCFHYCSASRDIAVNNNNYSPYQLEYDLILREDLFTYGNIQWYYFMITGVPRGYSVKFNIINWMKPDSLYNQGMQPLVYHELLSKKSEIGWIRGGYDICYYKNGLKYKKKKSKALYSLSFIYQFNSSPDDFVYFAYCYPYTYTNLQSFISEIVSDPSTSCYIRRQTLTKSLIGNTVDLLTITEPTQNVDEIRKRKGIFISARVHPGETVSSFIMEGVIKYLLSNDNPIAKYLRSNYIFKFVPMINVDGVIHGNYRCSLSGMDLNRRYSKSNKELYPVIHAIEKLVNQFKEDRSIEFYIDLHGHSRKMNSFIYGCSSDSISIKLSDHVVYVSPQETRIYPLLLETICDYKTPKGYFSFDDSRFIVQKSKKNTGRIYMYNVGIKYPMTIETSLCGNGNTDKTPKGLNIPPTQFRIIDLKKLGYKIIETLYYYDEYKIKNTSIFDHPIIDMDEDTLFEHTTSSSTTSPIKSSTDKLSPPKFTLDYINSRISSSIKNDLVVDDDDDAGSDSDPSEDEMDLEDLNKIPEYRSLIQSRKLHETMKKRKHPKKKKKHLTANMKIQKPSLNGNDGKNSHNNVQPQSQPAQAPPPPQQSKPKKHSKSHRKLEIEKIDPFPLKEDDMDYEVWLRTKKLERMSFNTNSVTPRYMRISEKYLPSKPPRALSTEPLIIKPVKQKMIELGSPLYKNSAGSFRGPSPIVTYSPVRRDKRSAREEFLERMEKERKAVFASLPISNATLINTNEKSERKRHISPRSHSQQYA